MNYQERLELWVEGTSIHDHETNTCVPDFSCCVKELKAPTEIRRKYLIAFLENDEITQQELLIQFLKAAIELKGHKVHIVE